MTDSTEPNPGPQRCGTVAIATLATHKPDRSARAVVMGLSTGFLPW